MGQIESSHSERKQISWAWLFLLLLTFVTIFIQVLSSYQVSHKGQKKYLEEKIVLDQILLQKAQEKKTSSKTNESRFNSLLDGSISSLIEAKSKHPEAAVLYALMRHEQGYKLSPSDISLLTKQKNSRYSSIYKIYTQEKINQAESQFFLSLFQGDNIVDRLIRVHIYEKMGHFEQRQKILPLEYWSELLQATGLYMLAGMIGVILIFIYQFKRKKGHCLPLNLSLIPSNFHEFDRTGKKALFVAMIINLMPLILLDQPVYFLVVSAGVIFTLIYYKWTNDPIIKSFKGKTNLLSQLGWGVGASLVNIPVVALFGLLSTLLQSYFPTMRHAATDIILSGQNPDLIMKMGFFACIIAPITEEILFRGLLLPSLIYRYKSPLWGIILTNFIFAAIHPQGIAGWPALFAVGVMSSLTFIQTGAILPSIIFHMIHNGSLLIMTYTLGLHL